MNWCLARFTVTCCAWTSVCDETSSSHVEITVPCIESAQLLLAHLPVHELPWWVRPRRQFSRLLCLLQVVLDRQQKVSQRSHAAASQSLLAACRRHQQYVTIPTQYAKRLSGTTLSLHSSKPRTPYILNSLLVFLSRNLFAPTI